MGDYALKSFPFWERIGLHVTPSHFYFPISPSEELTDALFDSISDCVGIDWNVEQQQLYLNDVFPRYATEIKTQENPGLSLVDAAILHAMIRHHKPKQVIEIGSGASTRFAANACLLNGHENAAAELVAIEPYPQSYLEVGFPGLSKLIKQKVQTVPLDSFANCDLLFIDSSHVVRIGGDVNYEILEIIPRLKQGALIHFHDILLPGEYWKEWVKDRHYYWSEQYLLMAFLQFNTAFKIVWASRFMHLNHSDKIQKIFPYFDLDKHHISSLWIQKVSS